MDMDDIIKSRLRELKLHKNGTLWDMEEALGNDGSNEAFDLMMPPLSQVMHLPPDANMGTSKYIPRFPKGTVRVKDFESGYWRIGQQPMGTFAQTLDKRTLDTLAFKTNRLKVFYPVFQDTRFVYITFHIDRPANINMVLRAIFITAMYASVYELTNDDRDVHYKVTTRQALSNLYGSDVTRFVVRRAGGGNQVYVRVKKRETILRARQRV
jgi:hypothetical protein